MKRTIKIITFFIISMAFLSGCNSQGVDLVSETPFPEFSEKDMEGNSITNDIFSKYDVTIVNFWNNGCGTCIAEMPELEEMYQDFLADNVNMLGVGTDSNENSEQFELARSILREKGVTYRNISPALDTDFYIDFIKKIAGYPTTYIVDSKGNIIGAPIIGNVKNQIEILQNRIDQIKANK